MRAGAEQLERVFLPLNLHVRSHPMKLAGQKGPKRKHFFTGFVVTLRNSRPLAYMASKGDWTKSAAEERLVYGCLSQWLC